MKRPGRPHSMALSIPGINTLALFLRGNVKDIVYHNKRNDLPDLQCKFTDTLTPEILRHTERKK
jgi:hypothetical protein